MMSEEKAKIAFYWAASCGGCEIAILDLDEAVLDVAAKADILFWPVAVDTKYHDVEAMPDNSIDVTFFNGGIRNSEAVHVAKVLRKKSKFLVAFGTCAHCGGAPALANFNNKDAIFNRVYNTTPSTTNPEGIYPQTSYNTEEGEVTIPEFLEAVYPLDHVVPVDYTPMKLFGYIAFIAIITMFLICLWIWIDCMRLLWKEEKVKK